MARFQTETSRAQLLDDLEQLEAGIPLPETKIRSYGYYDLAFLVFASERLSMLQHPLLAGQAVFSNDREALKEFSAAYLDLTTREAGESPSENDAKAKIKQRGHQLLRSSIPQIARLVPKGLPPTAADLRQELLEERVAELEKAAGD